MSPNKPPQTTTQTDASETFTQTHQLAPGPPTPVPATAIRLPSYAWLNNEPCILLTILPATTSNRKPALKLCGASLRTGALNSELFSKKDSDVVLVPRVQESSWGVPDSVWVPVSCVRKGGEVMLGKEARRPCRVVGVVRSRAGNGVKVEVLGEELGSGERVGELLGGMEAVEVPRVVERAMQLVDVGRERGKVSVLDENGEIEEGIKVHGQVEIGELRAASRGGEVDIEVMVLEVPIVGEKIVVGWKLVDSQD